MTIKGYLHSPLEPQHQMQLISISSRILRRSWWNGYRRRKWTRETEFDAVCIWHSDNCLGKCVVITIIGCGRSSVTTTCVSGWLVYQNSQCSRCVWKIHRWGITKSVHIFIQTVGMVCWKKLLVCWQLKDKKNSPLIINNYLLRLNDVTIIYIYI